MEVNQNGRLEGMIHKIMDWLFWVKHGYNRHECPVEIPTNVNAHLKYQNKNE
ncbi:unnamed protein product [Sphenostylis stenocarpa]|uniref:Uncharacterized protein n=1 Tax=Sphenostylis stenocarpa TaxID=92480 RepID=A0AA86SK58_9FABA|nr:unnamed protein product [Sphenostylis stenocarpa]